MVTTESSASGGARKMLKPLVEKRRRDRINRNLEELRLLLLQKTHCQALKNTKVEKAEILELAVGYLQEINAAKIQGAKLSEDSSLQTCYRKGFQECFGHLAAFLRQRRPSAQSHLWETLHFYLASRAEPRCPEQSFVTFSSSIPSAESPLRTPEGFCFPLPLYGPWPSSDGPPSGTGQPGSLQRHPCGSDASVKRLPPLPTYWRPWP